MTPNLFDAGTIFDIGTATDLRSFYDVFVSRSSPTPTPTWRGSSVYTIPLLTTACVYLRHGWPTWLLMSLVLPCAVVFIGGPMSVCQHRYFGHSAFYAGRAVQFGLALTACLAWQRGPLWWAGKHRRHHRHCDGPEDPHSACQTNFAYAWIGWLMTAKETTIDSEYIGDLLSFPELRVLERVWMVPPMVLNAWVGYAAGPHAMVCLITLPMLLCNLITTLFNVEYHPPRNPHKEGRACKAVDNARLLSELVGESYHDDHHHRPSKARRPGLDLPFWLCIRPLYALGLVQLRSADLASTPSAGAHTKVV